MQLAENYENEYEYEDLDEGENNVDIQDQDYIN